MTLYLVRHGSAGTRDSSDPDDSLRPLDETGRIQAELLARQLAHRDVALVVSSPFRRCIESVEPLATALGTPVVVDPDFMEGADIERSWGAVSVIASGAADSGTSALVCSHGDVIPDLIRRAQLRGLRVHGRSGCAKGSVWSLEGWDGERFGHASYWKVRP